MAQEKRNLATDPTDETRHAHPDDGLGVNGPKAFWGFIVLILVASLIAGFLFT